MQKLIEDYCDPNIIWKEITNNKMFFCEEHSFDGGFVSPALIPKDLSADGWKTMWMPKLHSQLMKIRNSLVHAREKREYKVILPTEQNSLIIQQYLPLISRIAQQIAIKS